MDREIKVIAKLPKGDANGLGDPDVIRRLFDDPTKMRVGIVLFNVPKFDGDDDAGLVTRKVLIHRVEVILDDTKGDASALERLLHRAYERRSGSTTLDSELEDDVRRAFDGISLIDAEAEETLFGDRDDGLDGRSGVDDE